MGVSPVPDQIVIQSHKGPYKVEFVEKAFFGAASGGAKRHYIIDTRVAELYPKELADVLNSPSILLIEAKEQNKSLERSPEYITQLVSHGIKRGHVLVAIGGGIIQDITCFIAAVLLRGIAWEFFPTTLLAQADSCIGSKSSINVGTFKNVVGTYTPPAKITISPAVLATLPEVEIRSGIGEMLKVHAIASPEAFDEIAADYRKLGVEPEIMQKYILRSLEIKKKIIEQDEFDAGIRNVMNFGHSFGHAIEAATQFGIPHGIAVTIGMDMAGFISFRLNRMAKSRFSRMHKTLRMNYCGFEKTQIPASGFFAAIAKDKKSSDTNLGLILPDTDAIPRRVEVANNANFQDGCREYLDHVRTS